MTATPRPPLPVLVPEALEFGARGVRTALRRELARLDLTPEDVVGDPGLLEGLDPGRTTGLNRVLDRYLAAA